MTFSEFKVKYASIFGFVFGITEKENIGGDVVEMANFYYIPTMMIDEAEFNIIFQNGNFRDTTKSRPIVKRGICVNSITMDSLENYDGENFGYKAESFLFGSPNYTNDLIDGYLQGYPVQVKTSFNWNNGTSNSNAI